MQSKKQTTYQTKLQDPRWQKNRLLVLDRDDWTCKTCNDDLATLHVHHLKYEPGKEPWEYPLSNFVTLCADCHREVELLKKENEIDQIVLHKIVWADGTVVMYVYAESIEHILVKIYLKDKKPLVSFTHSIESFFEIIEFYKKAAWLHEKDERERIKKFLSENPEI